MNCPDYNRLLSFVERRSSTTELEEIQEHIDACPDCFTAVVELTDSLDEDESGVSDEMMDSTLSADTVAANYQTRVSLTNTRVAGSQSKKKPVRDLGKPGTDIDHFRVIRTLGRGGMGQVLLARDMKLGRKVAIKIVKPELLGSQELFARFLFEVKTTARFNHPHIVTVYGVGQIDGMPYVALEYLEGQDLQTRIAAQAPTLHETLRILLAISEAIEEAHKHGILHRDLKPANVLIPQDGRVRVVDFGLALAFDGAPVQKEVIDAEIPHVQLHESRQEGLRGTPAYMAPEQWRGEECTPATDIWAVGLMLYELCTGMLPVTKTTSELLRSEICNDNPMPISGTLKDTPEPIIQLIEQCLEKDPKLRPTSGQVVEQLRELVYEGRRLTVEGESPFRGLLPFTERHAHWFFGRDAEISHCVEQLRHSPMVAVVGSSGAGKSSFIQAGVIPRLREQATWTILRFRPGQHPVRRLAAKIIAGLAGETGSRARPVSSRGDSISEATAIPPITSAVDELRDRIMDNPGQVALSLAELANQRGSMVLLLVDQMEEIFTQTTDPEERNVILHAMCGAADDATDPVRVVLTLRDDFLGHIARASDQAKSILQEVLVLKSPTRESLREVLVKPLEMVGYHYENPGTVEAMLTASKGDSILPLLQFTARMLWDLRDIKSRQINHVDYLEIGGVEGALAQHAESVLKRFTTQELGVARTLFLRLVTPERTRRTQSRSNLTDGLFRDGERVLNHLTQSRLIAARRTDDMDDEEAVYEFAHESLIEVWPTLSRWIDESGDEISFLNEVGQAAELWHKRGRRGAELWTDEALRNAILARNRASTPVPQKVQDFISNGEKRDARIRLRRRFWSFSVPTILIFASMIFAFQKYEADYQRDAAELQREQALTQRAQAMTAQEVAEAERVESLLDNARGALERTRLLESRAKLRMAAEQSNPLKPDVRGLWWQLMNNPLIWSKQLSAVSYGTAWSPRGNLIAVGSQSQAVLLIDADTSATRILREPGDQVHSVSFSPGGKLLIAGDTVGELYLYETATGELIKKWTGHKGRISSVSFNPSDGTLASAGGDGAIRIWEPDTGRELASFPLETEDLAYNSTGTLLAAGKQEGVRVWRTQNWASIEYPDDGPLGKRVAFVANTNELATGGVDGRIRIWNSETGALLKTLGNYTMPVNTLACSPKAPFLVSGHAHMVKVWDVAQEKEMGVFRDHGALSAAFSPDGEKVVSTGGVAMDVKVWFAKRVDAQTFKRIHAAIGGISFSPDNSTLVSSSIDGTVGIWDVRTGQLTGGFRGHSKGLQSAMSRDGSLIAWAGWDGALHLHDTTSRERIFIVQSHLQAVNSIAFEPNNRSVATASDDGTVKLWDTKGILVQTINAHSGGVFSTVFSPDGRLLATGSKDGVRVWELETGTELHHLQGTNGPVFGLDWSEDGAHIAFASRDSEFWLWNIGGKDSPRSMPVQGRINGLKFHPTLPMIALASANSTVQLVDYKGTQKGLLRGHTAEVNQLDFSADGSLLASVGDDGRVRTWNVKSVTRHWRGTVVMDSPPRILTQDGWVSLNEEPAPSPSDANWEKALEDAEVAVTSLDGKLLCIQDAQNILHAWNLEKDTETFTKHGVRQLVATPNGCLARHGEEVSLCTSSGEVIPLQVSATTSAIGAGNESLLVGTSDALFRFTLNGQPLGKIQLMSGVTAITEAEEEERGLLSITGYRDGQVQIASVEEEHTNGSMSLQQVPSSSVSRLIAGPSGTVAVGFEDGTVGLWELRNGLEIRKTRLHGSIQHLALFKETLVAGTDLGDSISWSLAPFYRDSCALLDQMWNDVPIVWKRGRAIRKEKPVIHPCFEEKK